MAMVAINTKEIVEVSQRMIGSTRIIVMMKAIAMVATITKDIGEVSQRMIGYIRLIVM